VIDRSGTESVIEIQSSAVSDDFNFNDASSTITFDAYCWDSGGCEMNISIPAGLFEAHIDISLSGNEISHTQNEEEAFLYYLLEIPEGQYLANIALSELEIEPLIASVTSDVSIGSAPLTVAFSTTVSGGSSPYEYSWDFGDGSAGIGASPTHVYQNVGDYTAIVTITDADDSTIQSSFVVSVSQGPGDETPDADDDGDDWTNAEEEECGTEPLDAASIPLDYDNDGICDVLDSDDDNDGDPDSSDCNDLDGSIYTGAAESCDNIDSDCDNSLVDESDDYDGDGEPDCIDTDDDNDGVLDWDDSDDTNPKICSDVDNDGCDDCSSGTYNPVNDGDGECDIKKSDGEGDPGGEGDDGWLTREMIVVAVAVFLVLLLVPIIIVLRKNRRTRSVRDLREH
jgi:PKD repeat protein